MKKKGERTKNKYFEIAVTFQCVSIYDKRRTVFGIGLWLDRLCLKICKTHKKERNYTYTNRIEQRFDFCSVEISGLTSAFTAS